MDELGQEILNDTMWLIILGVTIGFVIILMIITLSIVSSKKKKKAALAMPPSDYLKMLGGKENILTNELVGSRIVITLKDYSSVDADGLKKIGASFFILKSDKLTLVFKDGKAEAAYKQLFE